MKDALSLIAETARPVGHQSLALRGTDCGAQVRLAREAAFALTAFGGVERDDMVARLHRGDAGAHLATDPGPFLPHYAGKYPFPSLADERGNMKSTRWGK